MPMEAPRDRKAGGGIVRKPTPAARRLGWAGDRPRPPPPCPAGRARPGPPGPGAPRLRGHPGRPRPRPGGRRGRLPRPGHRLLVLHRRLPVGPRHLLRQGLPALPVPQPGPPAGLTDLLLSNKAITGIATIDWINT